jgi:hypothetical protein
MMSAGLRCLALALVVCGCANAGNGGSGDDTPKVDASTGKDSGGTIDSPPPIDAPLADAANVTADAAGADAGSGLFCTVNANCTVAGECCLTLGGGMGFCAPGNIVLGTCVPPL